MNKKVVSLYGFFGIDNVGNEAMLKALIEPIREKYNDQIEFIVFSRHPSKKYDGMYGCLTVKNLEHDTKEESLGRWLKGLNPDDYSSLPELIKNILLSDLMIIGPGQYLVGTGAKGLFTGALAQTAIITMLCRSLGVPIYGLALACEAINDPWSTIAISEILESMSLITFRDTVSLTNIDKLGISTENIEVMGDLALASQPAKRSLADDVMQRNKIPKKIGPRLAFAHRNLYFIENKEQVEKAYAASIKKWLDDVNRDILVISQCTYNHDNTRDDDRVAARNFFKKYGINCDRVYCIEDEFYPDVIESLYGQCDITLASRLHGSIFSCKQGTPPVVLNCLKKMKGFYNRLGMEELLISPDVKSDELINKLQSTYNRRKDLSDKILHRVSDVRLTAAGYSKQASVLLDANRVSEKQLKYRQLLGV